jgi:hypothetical protein
MHALLFGVMLPFDMSNHEVMHRNCDKTGSYAFWKGPKIWNPKPTVKAFHLIYYMTTFLKHYFFALDDHCPTPSEEPQHIKSISRHASFCRTSIWWHHSSGHVSVTAVHLPVMFIYFCCNFFISRILKYIFV